MTPGARARLFELVAVDAGAPDAPPSPSISARRRARLDDAPADQDGHAFGHRSVTSSTMWVDRITTTLSPISASRLLKRLRSSGSRPAVGSSTITSRGLPMSACAMPKRCRMPPRSPRWALRTSHRLTWRSKVSTVSRRSPRPAMPFSTARCVQHVGGRHARVDAEVLRQVTQRGARSPRAARARDVAEADGAAGGHLQRRQAAHEAALAGAVGAEQAEHAGRDLERHVVERAHAVRVDVAQVLDQSMAALPALEGATLGSRPAG